jgi:hypothetical protein
MGPSGGNTGVQIWLYRWTPRRNARTIPRQPPMLHRRESVETKRQTRQSFAQAKFSRDDIVRHLR